MVYELFNQIVNMSLMGTVSVIIILLIKAITKDKLGIKFQYSIWFILILRLIPITKIYSSISIYNYLPTYKDTIMNIPIPTTLLSVDKNIRTESFNSTLINRNIIYEAFNHLSIIWIAIVCCSIITVFFINARVRRKISKFNIIDDKNIISIFNDCKEKMNIKKNIQLIESDDFLSPCVYGIFKPKILIPKVILNQNRNIEFKYIFLHELTHIKHKDLIVNYIVFIISTLHWFNPVIQYGLKSMKEDMEANCDSYVLSIIKENELINYGNSLLDLLELSCRAPWLPQMAGIINNKKNITRRIIMIKKFKKGSYKLSVMAMAGLVLLGGGLLTEARAMEKNNSEEQQVIEDKIDYPFENDEEVIGKWESVDFVKSIEKFNPEKKSWNEDLYLKKLIVLPDGKMAQPVSENNTSDEETPVSYLTWTKGIIMHKGDKTASKYTIKEINGEKYMFYEWKSGDYTLRGMKPYYYVLKEVK